MKKLSLFILFTCLLPSKLYAYQVDNTYFCERDCSMEYNFFKRYARQGSSLASLSMAIMNYQGHGREKDIDLANRQLINASKAAEPAAMYQLAYNLMFGLYIKQDFNKSLVWFKRANKHGVKKSEKYITLLKSFLNIDNKEVRTSMKSMLRESINAEEAIISVQQKDEPIERITVSQQFFWSYVLYNARLQTCYVNCTIGSSHTLIPTIHVLNEEVLLAELKKLTNKSELI